MQDNTIIIGRKEEIEAVRDQIRHGKSVHIHGPEGVGKSVLIDYLYRTWGEIGTLRVPIYCKDSGTFEQILDTIATFLLTQGQKLVDIDYERRTERLITRPEELRSVSRRYLRNMVFPHIKRGKYCILLDNIENVTSRTASFLKALSGCSSVIAVSRESWSKTGMVCTGMVEYELRCLPDIGEQAQR